MATNVRDFDLNEVIKNYEVHSYNEAECVEDDIMLGDDTPHGQSYLESDTSELLNVKVNTADEAYRLYNDYAFKHGFCVRKCNTTKNTKNEVTVREYVCNKEGFKHAQVGQVVRFVKTDVRTGCKAMVRFHVIDGKHVVVTHEMGHNHPMIPPEMCHYLRSRRKVSAKALKTVMDLNSAGIGVATACRYLAKEAGGEQHLPYTRRDIYNEVAKERNKLFEGSDAKQLLYELSEMQLRDKDFYYEINVDSDGHISSLFYRDGRMAMDYEMFGDMMIFDTTFNTNKYGLLLAPFIGINHHGRNLMFGVGLIPKESKDSLFWLFRAFSKSMKGKHPETIMTDQAPGMREPIKEIFPETKHRLCTWHIVENSRNNLKKYYAMNGFAISFGYVLKYTDTVAEFERYWAEMMKKYNCGDVEWLQNLYKIKELWCPAYNKDVFSGGIISSQESESANSSIKRRLSKTSSLLSVYNALCDIVNEWRERENADDFDSINGNIHFVFNRVPILVHGRQVYTKQMYRYFQDEYVNANECQHELKHIVNQQIWIYHVWAPEFDNIRHQVCFDVKRVMVECTCKKYTEVGLLCQHILRVFILHCVTTIPKPYIKWRWTKDAMIKKPYNEQSNNTIEEPLTVWRSHTMRTYTDLVFSSVMDPESRKIVDETTKVLREKLEKRKRIADGMDGNAGCDNANGVVDVIGCDSSMQLCAGEIESLDIRDPTSRLPTYEQTSRHKSITEKARKRKQNSWTAKRKSTKTHMRVNATASINGNGFVPHMVHPMDASSTLCLATPVDGFFTSL